MSLINDEFIKNEVAISFNIAKTTNGGEDADPVLLYKDNQYFLSVCDGMGGAGSTTYEVEGLQKSGAYLSSRIVNKQAEIFFSNFLNNKIFFKEDDLSDLRRLFLDSLQHELVKLKKDGISKLKSKLLKDLPTTFSGLFITNYESYVEICSIWAGDSRNYLLTETDGLQQLSSDDLKQKFDPLENLSKDSPLDNVVSAEGDFRIRFIKVTTNSPCILFTATDGCYGYFNTPMQFEYALLQAMLNSNSVDDWQKNLITEIGAVAGDDYSISLVAIGYKDFTDVKSHFASRRESLYGFYITDLLKEDMLLNKLQLDKINLENRLRNVEDKRGELQKNIWSKYKRDYLKYIQAKL